MKKIILLLLLLGCVLHGYSQKPISVDEYMTIPMPGKFFQLDTTINNVRLIQKYSVVRYASYIVQKLPIEKEEGKLSLPHDKKSLDVTYLGMEKGFLEGVSANGFEKLSASDTTMNGLDWHIVKLKMQKRPVGEARFLVLGESIYSISYIDPAEYMPDAARSFFSGITIKKDHPGQFAGEGPGYRRGYIIGVIIAGLALLGGFIFLIVKIMKK